MARNPHAGSCQIRLSNRLVNGKLSSVFTIKSPWRLDGEDTEQMYSKHLRV